MSLFDQFGLDRSPARVFPFSKREKTEKSGRYSLLTTRNFLIQIFPIESELPVPAASFSSIFALSLSDRYFSAVVF